MNDEQKKEYRAKLESIGGKIKKDWHSQEAHKIAAAAILMDLAKIKEPAKRDEIMKAWLALPASLGANASAFAQQLGRETEKAKIERVFSGF